MIEFLKDFTCALVIPLMFASIFLVLFIADRVFTFLKMNVGMNSNAVMGLGLIQSMILLAAVLTYASYSGKL